MSDLIDRREAIDALRKYLDTIPFFNTNNMNAGRRDATISCMQILEYKVPSVEPERKRGKWIEADAVYGLYKCSICKMFVIGG